MTPGIHTNLGAGSSLVDGSSVLRAKDVSVQSQFWRRSVDPTPDCVDRGSGPASAFRGIRPGCGSRRCCIVSFSVVCVRNYAN